MQNNQSKTRTNASRSGRALAFVPKDLNNAGDTVNKIPPTPIVATAFSKESNLFA
jgi:hypothetical protein